MFFSIHRDSSCLLSMEKLLESRIAAAMDLRKRLGLPDVDTNVYRLVNSEGDRQVFFHLVYKIILKPFGYFNFTLKRVTIQRYQFSFSSHSHALYRLSGLIVDIFGENAVVASSAAWVEKFRTTIEAVLKHTVKCKHVCWRPSLEMLKEEGIESESVQNDSSIAFGTLDMVEVILSHHICSINYPKNQFMIL